jgi:hypothetical protein
MPRAAFPNFSLTRVKTALASNASKKTEAWIFLKKTSSIMGYTLFGLLLLFGAFIILTCVIMISGGLLKIWAQIFEGKPLKDIVDE